MQLNSHIPTKFLFVPKVFSEHMIWRIKAVNRAIRELKAIGFKVIGYDLEPNGAVFGPRIQVAPIDLSATRQLKNRSQSYNYKIISSSEKHCYVYFDDITVWWKELS